MWERVALSFEGPELKEERSTFLNYRLQVLLHHKESNTSYNVPGFYAADGNSSQSSASSGKVWKIYFTPDHAGEWTYKVDFKVGDELAISLDQKSGATAGYFDGEEGKFTVGAKNENETLNKGMLKYVGSHYLQYAGSKDYFLKGGAGSPENFLAYAGFDGTYDNGGQNFPALGENQIHNYRPHLKDWKTGDPVWKDNLGKEIIGSLNYIADKGLNAVYMLTMNVEADGQDIWPWTHPDSMYIFDVSKLDQWEIVFDHMDKKAILQDILLTETENESLFEAAEGGSFAVCRKLYYREMIARFGHHLSLSWNLGEEVGHDGTGEMPFRKPTNTAQHKAFSSYIRAMDPYNHLIVAHIWTNDEDIVYKPLLGFEDFDGLSFQDDNYYNKEVKEWVDASSTAGRKWVISMDEPLGWEFGLKPDALDEGHFIPRSEVLWPVIMAGGAGVDWYFGWQNNAPTSDLSNEDWRSRNNMWEQTKTALDFYHQHLPFYEMNAANELASDTSVLVFTKENDTHLVYMKESKKDIKLKLPDNGTLYEVNWFDPENGGSLQKGSEKIATSSLATSIGSPPTSRDKDWICLLKIK